jgi:hypothetical protein
MGKKSFIKIRKTLVISLLVLILMSLTAASVSAYNNPTETKWKVASFDNGVVGTYNPVPWEFQSHTANAGTLWTGKWSPIRHSDDRITMSSQQPGGVLDQFEVVFLSPNWFVAVHNNEPYRLGQRI